MENANPGRPEGKEGIKMIKRMNDSHAPLREWAFSFLDRDLTSPVLDAGCGGGGTLSDLHTIYPVSDLFGIDYSPDCVSTASEYCPYADISLGDVSSLPYDDDKFGLVTAVETVYFWKEPEKAFSEILRVLQPKGSFAVICEADGPGRFGPDTAIYYMVMYTPAQLKKMLIAAGFREVRSFVKGDGYMTVIGEK